MWIYDRALSELLKAFRSLRFASLIPSSELGGNNNMFAGCLDQLRPGLVRISHKGFTRAAHAGMTAAFRCP